MFGLGLVHCCVLFFFVFSYFIPRGGATIGSGWYISPHFQKLGSTRGYKLAPQGGTDYCFLSHSFSMFEHLYTSHDHNRIQWILNAQWSGLKPGPARPEKRWPTRPKKRPGPAGAVHVSLLTPRHGLKYGPARPESARWTAAPLKCQWPWMGGASYVTVSYTHLTLPTNREV